MRHFLDQADAELPDRLRDPSVKWYSLFINDEDPFVERIWTVCDGYRLLLHDMHPPRPSTKALLHPHRWKSGVRIKRSNGGVYRMEYGISADGGPPAALEIREYREGDTYTMERPEEWHSVHTTAPMKTIMVTSNDLYPGVPERTVTGRLGPIAPAQMERRLDEWRDLYPVR